MQTLAQPTSRLVGSYRRFGLYGPVYQVIEELDSDLLKITVVETGETLIYPRTKAIQDPAAE